MLSLLAELLRLFGGEVDRDGSLRREWVLD